MRLIIIFSILSFFVATNLKAGAAPEEMTEKKANESLFRKVGKSIHQVRESLRKGLMKLKDYGPCEFEKMKLLCCVKTFFSKICTMVIFDPNDFSAKVSFKHGEKVFLQRTLSGKNPPPMCEALPYFPMIQFCFTLRGITMQDKVLTSCAHVEARMVNKPIVALDLNCLKIRKNGFEFVGGPNNAKIPLIINASKINPLLGERIEPLKLIG